jgi:16S rRNA (adenine1518-N6/adenine1519-N6)-dimethyltransferase
LKVRDVRDLFDRHNFRPNKKLGQIFLMDENILKKLSGTLDIKDSEYILEIGPGFGNLTRYLLEKAKKVFVVEKDARLCDMMKEYLKDNLDNLEIICCDILEFDIRKLYRETSEKLKIIGNLPYYITTPIILNLIKNKDCISSIQLTVQKEVADRMLAEPSTRDYSFLTLLVQFNFAVSKLFDISRNCFLPTPEVDSTVVKLCLTCTHKEEVINEAFLFKLIDAGFKQRRKMLVNLIAGMSFSNVIAGTVNCGNSKEEIAGIFEELGIDPKVRAENLFLEEFIRLSNRLFSTQKTLG